MIEHDHIEMINNFVVTKSNKLIQASYNLSVVEQKIILFLISQIRKEDEDFKIYTLSIKEFNELLGNKGTPKYTELRQITKKMFGKVLEIWEDSKLKQLSWISYVEYKPNEGSVDISFDPRLKPYLLQLKREFTSYKLINIMKLRGTYSIRIYEILKQWEPVKKVEIPLEKLKKLLGIEDKYKEYHNLKKRVLNPAKKEINENTDITFDYEEIKKGRMVIAFRFYIERNNNPKLKLEDTQKEGNHNLINNVISSSKQGSKQEKSKAKNNEKVEEIQNEKETDLDWEENQWLDSLFVELAAMFKEYEVKEPTKETVKRWIKLADQYWKVPDKYLNIRKITKDVLENNEINNPIGYITNTIKNGMRYTYPTKVVRQELLPEWFFEKEENE